MRHDIDLVGRADAEVTLASGGRTARVGGASCVRFDLPYRWATKACLTALAEPPPPAGLEPVLLWLREQSAGGGWVLVVREAHAEDVRRRAGLRVDLVLQVLATRTAPADAGPTGLSVEVATSEADVLTAYGADLGPLVRGRVGLGRDTWLVAREDGAVVACARVREACGTAYVSAVTVLASARGHGVGRAVTAAATRFALGRAPLAWLECEAGLRPLYTGLGYRDLTSHVQLGPG